MYAAAWLGFIGYVAIMAEAIIKTKSWHLYSALQTSRWNAQKVSLESLDIMKVRRYCFQRVLFRFPFVEASTTFWSMISKIFSTGKWYFAATAEAYANKNTICFIILHIQVDLSTRKNSKNIKNKSRSPRRFWTACVIKSGRHIFRCQKSISSLHQVIIPFFL